MLFKLQNIFSEYQFQQHFEAGTNLYAIQHKYLMDFNLRQQFINCEILPLLIVSNYFLVPSFIIYIMISLSWVFCKQKINGLSVASYIMFSVSDKVISKENISKLLSSGIYNKNNYKRWSAVLFALLFCFLHTTMQFELIRRTFSMDGLIWTKPSQELI